jgi:hypothetical protein
MQASYPHTADFLFIAAGLNGLVAAFFFQLSSPICVTG